VAEKRKKDISDNLGAIIATLRDLSPEEQLKLLETVATFFGLRGSTQSATLAKGAPNITPVVHPPGGGFSEPRDLSPKEFVMQKQPRTDVERVACLAFYLTHYRNMPYFKTIYISKLNTEAAQSKMSNAHVAVNNATQTGYLVPALRGTKQISAAGEVFVQALPDRDAAKAAMSKVKPRKKSRKLVKAKK
jgi:hypothetical protein